MKKTICILCAALVLCMSLSVMAEGTDYSGKWIRNTSSSMGGIWYPMAVAMDLIWEENLSGISTKVITGSSAENVRLAAAGETEIGWCHSVAIVDAFNGRSPYDDGGDYTNIGHLATIHPAALHCYAAKNSGIQSLADLNGKNVGFGSASATVTVAMKTLLEEQYGITEESIIAAGGTVSYGSNSDNLTMMQDHQLDIFFSQSTYPSTDITEIEDDLVLVPIDADKLEAFIGSSAQWLPCTIPGGTYKNQPEDYNTMASYVVIACPLTMDEQMAYDMTKTMWENVDRVWEASADAKRFMSLDIATICKDIIPLHPGAARYYQEIGLIG